MAYRQARLWAPTRRRERSHSQWRAGTISAAIAGQLDRRGQRLAPGWLPYEEAMALAEANEEEPLRRALDALRRLGARPAAAIVARRLRMRGVRGLPRGRRPSTRSNPAQLSERELDVLALLSEGRRNADIAEQLSLSTRTVDHHVSAILGKLGAKSRAEASRHAARLGIVPRQDGQPLPQPRQSCPREPASSSPD
jgi:DNA-binding CsgD family transcriptional regulator